MKLTTNAAGGTAIALDHKEALVKIATTGIANKATTNFDTDTFLLHCMEVPTDYLVKLSIYARKYADMKDLPLLITAFLATTPSVEHFAYAFNYNVKSLRDLGKFVMYLRDGTVKKSLGSRAKRWVQNFLTARTNSELFAGSIGAQPALKDVIRLAHPKAINESQNNMFKYLMGFEDINADTLPEEVKAYEAFKAGLTTDIPKVPLEKLLTLVETDEQWSMLFQQMTWNQIRINLNNLAKHNVFKNQYNIEETIEKLSDFAKIPKTLWAFGLQNTVENLSDEVPLKIQKVLSDAVQQTFKNTPEFKGETIIFVDSSGSMNCPLVNSFKTKNQMTYTKIASFFAAGMLTRNPETTIAMPFDTKVWTEHSCNKEDTFEEVIVKLKRGGGGTDVAATIQYLIENKIIKNNIIIISDNESWRNNSLAKTLRAGGGYEYKKETSTSALWNKYKEIAPKAKLILWDIQPSDNSQISSSESTFLVSGYNDTVIKLIDLFLNNNITSLSSIVEEIKLG